MSETTPTEPTVNTVRDLIWLWAVDGDRPYVNLADDLGLQDYQPRDWARRGAVPADQIHPLVNAAQRRGFHFVTHEFVARLLATEAA